METWASRIKDLEAAGWSHKDISTETGLAPSSISDIKNGRSQEPTGMRAVRLHELHRKECPSKPRKAVA